MENTTFEARLAAVITEAGNRACETGLTVYEFECRFQLALDLMRVVNNAGLFAYRDDIAALIDECCEAHGEEWRMKLEALIA